MYANYYPIPETGRATGNSCSHANSLVRGWSTYQDCLCSFLFPLPLFLCLCIAFSLVLLLFVLFFHAGSLGFSRPLCTVSCKLQGRETTSLRVYTYVKRNWPWFDGIRYSGGVASVANSVPPSPPASGRMQNTESQVQQDSASAFLFTESFAEKERRLSEMILQLQLLREQLLQQQDQSKVGGLLDFISGFTGS